MLDKALSVDISLPRHAFTLTASAQFKPRGITAIFGPSGAGKSSLLRAVAGFETPASGRIALGEETLFDSAAKINLPAHRRSVGYLFQDARLFSHLNVKGNLDYAAARAPKRVSGGVEHVVGAFDLGDLLNKDIATLSGGEQQRVALARTILSGPDILLLDEPLAALDRPRKAELMPFIKSLADDFNLPVVFVSHDLWEVGTLADRIIRLEEGQITASGPALSILPKLQSAPDYHHDFATWFDANLIARDDENHADIWSLSADHKLILPLSPNAQIGDKARLYMRADDVSIALQPPDNISIQNRLDARVKSITPHGPRILVELYLPDIDSVLPSLYAFITPLAQADLTLNPGQTVTALVKSVSLSQG